MDVDVNVLTFSRTLQVQLQWHAASNTQKCARSVFSHRVCVFHERFPQPTVSKGSVSAEGASEENWRFCGMYCVKFTLKAVLEVHKNTSNSHAYFREREAQALSLVE